ncbi:MAG: efflux RND transporter permease subunit [Candidatus Moraniibacteriota bacterium]|nr:MAG: efflux RND transporter permease subunit [Candidatus Moranbacteria bacterium]
MSYTKSFFDRLHFDEMLRGGVIGRYFQSTRTIVLITATVIIAGVASYSSLKKELNPDIQIPTVIIATAFPGAGPEDVEDLVTIPIEDAVNGLSDVTRVTSSSEESFSSIVVEFSSTIDPEKAKSDVQNAVDRVTALPESAQDPSIEVIDFTNQPVMLFALSAPSDEAALPKIADELLDRVKALPAVEKVSLTYRRDPEVSITLAPETIAAHRISVAALARTIEAALGNFPGGTVAADATTLSLDQEKEVDSIEELRHLPIEIGGETLPLGSLAVIAEQEQPGTPSAYVFSHEHDTSRAIFFATYQTEDADTRESIDSIEEAIATYRSVSPVEFQISTYFNGAEEIDKSFSQLQRDFLITFGLVFVMLLLFFGVRQSVIAAFAIPFTFLATFVVMQAVGISINFISLFSLLLALGILVDNAIVVISAIASYHRSGKFTPSETALLVLRDFGGVIAVTTITTVWAFVPLLLSTGIIGEFIRPIPVVVSTALALSAATALFIVIPYMAIFLEGEFPRRVAVFFQGLLATAALGALFFIMPSGPMKWLLYPIAALLLGLTVRLARSFFRTVTAWKSTRFGQAWLGFQNHGVFSLDALSLRYSHLIEQILSSRRARRLTIVFLIVFMLSSYALVPLGFVVNEFFPGDDIDVVYVSVELPVGTTAERASAAIHELLPRFQTLAELDFVLAEIGASAPTDSNTSVTSKDFRSILFTLHLNKAKERERKSSEIVTELEQSFADWSDGKITASQLSGGPPAGADLQLKLLGPDLETLERLAEKTKRYLEQVPGTSNVSVSLSSAGKKLSFVPNAAALSANGLSALDTGTLLRTLGSGYTVKEDVRFGDDKRNIMIRLSGEDFGTPEAIGRLSISTSSGNIVPLLSLGTLELRKNPTLITREDEKRSISVSAAVAEGYSITELNTALEEFADTELGLPADYSWKTGGVNEENNKSVQSILYAMLLSAILIFATMVIQFNSFRKAMIVLLVIPIAVSGVFVIFALFGIPLSFPALIGVLALFGIVVNNSIIMVDKINKNLDLGLPVREAVVEGATSRLEPILLTALTTIVGLIPITLSDPIWQGLGGAIIAGLSFSGIAKLFFIPVIYEMWFDKEKKQMA